MRFPGYGRRLFEARMRGERPRVVALLIGERWALPPWLPRWLPRVAVKTARWAHPDTERYEWRIVAKMTVLAIDVRAPEEIVEARPPWDEWFWLLADVRRHARELLMFTPTIAFTDPPCAFAPERELETFAWLHRDGSDWPPWWPYGDSLLEAAA